MKKTITLLTLIITLTAIAQEANVNNSTKPPVAVAGIPQKLKVLAGQQKMNVIFILTDDHRYDFMGFTGKLPWQKTPALDKLAAGGAYLKMLL